MNILFNKIDTSLCKLNINIIDKKIFIAFSGGPDSVFLLEYILSKINKSKLNNITVLHINHHLRGVESDDDEKFIVNLCNSKNLKLIVEHININDIEKGSIEDRARKLRYRIFAKYSSQYDYLVTGHNMNDTVETMIFNFFRGSGIRGLSGISKIRGKYLRPLLSIKKEEILDFLNKNGIQYRIDSSNINGKYTRNVIRNDIIPYISEKLNLELIERLGSNVELYINERVFIEKHTEKVLDASCISVSNGFCCKTDSLLLLSKFERGEIYRELLKRLGMEGGGDLSFTNETDTILQLSKESYKDFYNKMTIYRVGNRLLFLKGKYSDYFNISEKILSFPFTANFSDNSITISGGNYNVSHKSDKEKIVFINKKFIEDGKIIVRYYKAGDKMAVNYAGKIIEKKLKHIFSSKKIGRIERKNIPIITSLSGEILWITGIIVNPKIIGNDYYIKAENKN